MAEIEALIECKHQGLHCRAQAPCFGVGLALPVCTRGKRVTLRAVDADDLDLLGTNPREILTKFAGWIAFEKADGQLAPVASLVSHNAAKAIEHLLEQPGNRFTPRRAAEVQAVAARTRSTSLARCASALREGLTGVFTYFTPGDLEQLGVLAEEGPKALGFPEGAKLDDLRSAVHAVGAWAHVGGISESGIGTMVEEYTTAPATFAGIVRLVDLKGLPYGRLVARESWAIVAESIERARTGQLGFDDGPKILKQLTCLEPDWANQGSQILDAISRSGRGEDACCEISSLAARPGGVGGTCQRE